MPLLAYVVDLRPLFLLNFPSLLLLNPLALRAPVSVPCFSLLLCSFSCATLAGSHFCVPPLFNLSCGYQDPAKSEYVDHCPTPTIYKGIGVRIVPDVNTNRMSDYIALFHATDSSTRIRPLVRFYGFLNNLLLLGFELLVM